MNRCTELSSLLPARDNEGFLHDPAAPWQVIDFIRAWYDDNESVPEARRVYGRQACRRTGMRKPLKLMLDV